MSVTGQNALTVLLLAASGVGAVLLTTSRVVEEPSEREPEIVFDWHRYTQAGHQIGPARAPVKLVLFSDYECPFCAQLWSAIDSARQVLGDTLSVTVRHYYNAAVHPGARSAALAAECAAAQGAFETLHPRLYELPSLAGGADIRSLAAFVDGLDAESFADCVRSEAFQFRLDEDRAAGDELGIRGTPTYLINSSKWDGATNREVLVRLVRDAAMNIQRE